MDRIATDGYIPDEQDILRARATTTGVYETEFEVNNAHFRMVDVGGQRTERKKYVMRVSRVGVGGGGGCACRLRGEYVGEVH